jgi:hypothetical protein
MARPSLSVTVTWIVLVLSALYALTFSYMLYLSLEEQVFATARALPRYAGPMHHHNAAEWVLIVLPALAGWVGVGFSTTCLTRRWLRPRHAER